MWHQGPPGRVGRLGDTGAGGVRPGLQLGPEGL